MHPKSIPDQSQINQKLLRRHQEAQEMRKNIDAGTFDAFVEAFYKDQNEGDISPIDKV